MEPNTGGQLRTRLEDMEIGDYIQLNMNWSVLWPSTFNLGSGGFAELPVTGSSSPTGFFYAIKVKRGTLISDRVLLHSVSWDTLNNAELIQGMPSVSLPGVIVRSLGGGNSPATADGNSSAINTGNGAWPVDNEWDRYIVGMFEGRDDVWHWSNAYSWCQDTPTLAYGDSGRRIYRGYTTGANGISRNASATVSNAVGFRPVFQYQEGGEG